MPGILLQVMEVEYPTPKNTLWTRAPEKKGHHQRLPWGPAQAPADAG